MTDEVEDHKEEIEGLHEDIRQGIKKLSGIESPDERATDIKALFGRLRRLEECNSAYDLELRELPVSEATPYYPKIAEFEKIYIDLKQQLEEWKKTNDRQRLGLDAKPTNADTDLDEADRIQIKSKDAVGRINKRIDETGVIGADIVTTIHKDNETLIGMKKDFEQMDDGIEQSKKLIKSILISIQRDKCIKAVLFIILLALLAVLIWAIFDPGFKIPSSQPPTSTVPS